jgi:hypothetical protein
MDDIEVWFSAYLAALAGGSDNLQADNAADIALLAYKDKVEEIDNAVQNSDPS